MMHPSFTLNNHSYADVKACLKHSKDINLDLYAFLKEWFDDSSFITINTSGSTGVPKQISVLKSHMVASAKATGVYFNIQSGAKVLCCLDTRYIAGKMMVVRALTLGWHLHWVLPTLEPLAGNSLQYDFAAMVPLQVSHSMNDLHRIKTLIIGGGVVSTILLQQLQQLPTKCFATYGMTETVSHIAVKPLNHQSRSATYELFPGVQIRVDERDCLVITAPMVVSTTLVTNDVVKLIDATHFEWLGRADFVINTGGVKIHPEQLETKMAPYIQQRFFVHGVPDVLLGNRLVLIVEGKSETIDFGVMPISKYEVPKEVFFVPQFVETDTKKVQRFKTLDLIDLAK